jgi:hypothetical protein
MKRSTLLALFMLALSARLAYLAFLALRYPLHLDGAEMTLVAMNIAEGRGFSSPYGAGSAPTAHFAPAIPYLWAVVFEIAGVRTSRSAHIIQLLQTIPSALAVVLYAAIAFRICEKWRALPRLTPVIVGVVMAFWPESLLRLTNTWYYQWQEAGLALMVLLGIAWIDNPSVRTAAAVGLSAGAVALINPTPAPVLAPILAVPLVSGFRIRWEHVPAAVIGGVVSLLVILPWTIRNYQVFGELVPIRGNMAMQLYSSHRDGAGLLTGRSSYIPGVSSEARARLDSLGERRYVAWAKQEAREYMRANPRLTFERTVRRAILFWTTDVFDTHRWSPTMPRWWQRCCGRQKVERLGTILCALLPLAIVVLGAISGRLRGLPYKPVFLGILLLVPLPAYMISPNDVKGMVVRSWLGVLSVLTLLVWARIQSRARPVPAPPEEVAAHAS